MQVDGDGQHDARQIPRLLAALRADPDLNMVTGSRFLARATATATAPRRRAASASASSPASSRWSCGRPVTDPTSGFRMTDRRGIELFARDYPHDYPEVEAVLMIARPPARRDGDAGARCAPRQAGVSSINSTQSVYYMVKVLLAVFVGLLRARPAVERRRRRARHGGALDLMEARIQIVAIIATGGAVRRSSSSSCAAAG